MRRMITALFALAVVLILGVGYASAWDVTGTCNVNATDSDTPCVDEDLSARFAAGEANTLVFSWWLNKTGAAPAAADVNASAHISQYGSDYFEDALVTFLDGTTAATSVPLAGNATRPRTVKLENWSFDAFRFFLDSVGSGSTNGVVGWALHGE